MKKFCQSAIEILNSCTSEEYAVVFVRLKFEFFKKFQNNLIFSTIHGTDFFKNVIDCIDGQKWGEQGECGNNFRKMVEPYFHYEI